MINISAELPLNQFAVKIAERTGLPSESVVHVLATAIILAGEEAKSDFAGNIDAQQAVSNSAKSRPLRSNSGR